jgi:hypothetical protein
MDIVSRFVDGPFAEYRSDSSMVIVREQASDPSRQEAFYYNWDGIRFRLIARVREKKKS